MTAIDLDTIVLTSGSHKADTGYCAMELASRLAGERWSDHPQCVSPVIGAFLRSWNDSMNDTDRQILKPLIPLVLNTRTTDADEVVRAWMATDWLVRVHTPAWLRLAGLTANADALEGLPELTNGAQVPSIKPVLEAARKDADAAGAAAGAAARDAARDAARAAARDAAWVAARDAAGDAAWDAARAALDPTVRELQASAVELVKRMAARGTV